MKTYNRFIMILMILAITFVGIIPKAVFADGVDIDENEVNLIVVKGDEQGEINGSAGATEYVKTLTLNNGFVNFQIQTYRHPTNGFVEEEIQFLFTIDDDVTADGDLIRVFFDIDHNHDVYTPDPPPDRGIQIRRYPVADVDITEVTLFGQPTEIGPLDPSQWQIDSNSEGWVAEVKIKASDIDLNFIPSLMGVFIEVADEDYGETTTVSYPNNEMILNFTKLDVDHWANLKTRRPLEYVVLLDRSGSMSEDFLGNYSSPKEDWKWTATKKATDIFAQIYYAFRLADHIETGKPYYTDSIGLATYNWEASWCDGYGNDSRVVKTPQILKDIVHDGYVDSAPAPDPPSCRTPIKRGLNVAFSMFSVGPDYEKVILLMSDGLHNEPNSDYKYGDAYIFPGSTGVSDYQVNTVALGEDYAVDTALLQDISFEFSGFGRSYGNATEEAQLVDEFVANLYSHLYLNQVPVDGTTGEFEVDPNEPRLLVMLVWNSETGMDQGFRLQKPDDSIIDTTDPGYHHYRDAVLDYEIAYYLIDLPAPSGMWQTIETSSTNPEVADNNFALFDPTVYAYFSTVQTGDDFILKTTLREAGVPITGSDATVIVDITKPDEGLGTYASTAQDDCTFQEATIQGAQVYSPIGWAFREIHRFLSSLFITKTMTTTDTPKPVLPISELGIEAQPLAVLPAARVEATAVEPLPPHFALVHELLLVCEKDGLDRSVITLQLYDDGTHGDEVEDDGVFTLLFDDTQSEGTYTFDFIASGTSPTGSDFSRVRTLSAHKSVAVDPAQTIFVFVELYQEGYFAFTQYYVLPRDQNGEYLGPGHVSEIEFSTTGGEWQTQVLDHNNGWYSRMLRYDTRSAEPFVSPVIQGQSIQLPWMAFLYMFLLLLLVLLLVLLWRWIRRRRSGS